MISAVQALLLPLLAATFASSLYSFLPGLLGFMCAFLCLIVLGVWALVSVIQLLIALIRGRWRRAGVLVLIVGSALPLAAAGLLSGDYIHLAINYPRYRAAVELTSTRPVRFPWGDYAVWVTDGLQARTLLYDDADKLMPPDRTSEGLWVRVRPFVWHFYIETVSSW